MTNFFKTNGQKKGQYLTVDISQMQFKYQTQISLPCKPRLPSLLQYTSEELRRYTNKKLRQETLQKYK
jgi:hypothetical protein